MRHPRLHPGEHLVRGKRDRRQQGGLDRLPARRRFIANRLQKSVVRKPHSLPVGQMSLQHPDHVSTGENLSVYGGAGQRQRCRRRREQFPESG